MEELKFYQGKENFAPSYRIRKAVFGVEQGFEHDFDEEDDTAEHLVVYKDGEPVATARCMPSGKPDGYYIGRVAVVREERKNGYGRKMIRAIEKRLAGKGAKRIELYAEVYARPFYEKLGYAVAGEVFLDEGCPHVLMAKEV